jgi:hypothetical protein
MEVENHRPREAWLVQGISFRQRQPVWWLSLQSIL